MALHCSWRPLTPAEWIDYINSDFTNFYVLLGRSREDKMYVCFDVEWDWEDDCAHGVLCPVTGSFIKGNKLCFTFDRNALGTGVESYTYSEVLGLLKKNMDKEVWLFDLDNNKECPAYYGWDTGAVYLSVIATSKPD